jgi:hypothetical protein
VSLRVPDDLAAPARRPSRSGPEDDLLVLAQLQDLHEGGPQHLACQPGGQVEGLPDVLGEERSPGELNESLLPVQAFVKLLRCHTAPRLRVLTRARSV